MELLWTKSIIEITLSTKEKQKLVQEFKEITYDPLGGERYIELLRKKYIRYYPKH